MTLGELSESDDDAPVDAAAAAKAAKKIAKAAKKAAAKKAAAAVPTIGSQTIHLPRALSSPTKPRPPADVDDKAFGFLSATSTAAEKARLAIARAGRASASASGKGAGAIKKGARTASSAGAGGTSTIARLVEEKRAEEARKRKLATQTKKLDAQVAEECANRDRERAMAMASLVADREVRAMHAVTDRVREMERDANEQLEDGESGGIDETPYPSDVVRALSDDAFVLSADDDDVGEEEDDAYHAGEDGDDDVPSDLRQFADAAEAGAASRGDLREAANETARKEALREVLTGGWLARAFISRTDAAAAATTTTEGETETAAACAADTARWLWAAATDVAASRAIVLGARDALLAASGHEPLYSSTCGVARRRRGVGVLRPAPRVSWAPTAKEVLRALAANGVVAAAAKSNGGAKKKSAGRGSKRGGDGNGNAKAAAAASENSGRAAFPLSGRGVEDQREVVALTTPAPGALRPQIFAVVQLTTAWCDVAPDDGGCATDADAASDLLAVLASLHRDPRAGACYAAIDAASTALVSAFSGGVRAGDSLCLGSAKARARENARATRWREFADAAAPKLARTGPTHASRLAAIRWLPWRTRREQELQDVAALRALEDVVPHVLREAGGGGAAAASSDDDDDSGDEIAVAAANPPAKRAKTAGGDRELNLGELQAAAVRVLSPVVVGAETSADAAWALWTAIHLCDTALHSGAASGGGAGGGAPHTPGKQAAEASSLSEAVVRFMGFLKTTKASIPRGNKTALAAAKNLAVAVMTRHQRAQQLRETKHELAREDEDDEDDEGEEEEEEALTQVPRLTQAENTSSSSEL
jgi:hypothetical protein